MISVTETDDCVTITNKITYTVNEEFDRFVFLTLESYLKRQTKMVVSKAMLIRALVCFQVEHPEEYKYLQEQMEEGD